MHSVKVISSIIILLSVIIGVSIFTTRTLSTSSERLQVQIDMLEKGVLDDNWDNVEVLLSGIENDWIKTERSWAKLIDHIEIDYIDNTLSRLSKHVQTKNKTLALAEAAALKKYVQHIPDKESLQWDNLF